MGRGHGARLLGAVLVAAALAVGAVEFMNARWIGSVTARTPGETTAELDNPDRGFYYIHGFLIEDEMDWEKALADSYAWDRETRLSLVECNLQRYSGGEISQKGLDNMAGLFGGLRALGKHYIVRFVYDWDGKNMEVEPTTLAVVKRHMEQISGLVGQNKDQIFTLQGLFVGNWGEMNGTRYAGKDNWRALARQLVSVTDGDVYLAVRMPFQWRCVTGYPDLAAIPAGEAGFAARLGLFNDGMMGSESDLGTYGNTPRSEGAYDDIWRREDELAFQEELCKYAPNGGEVVYDTPYNDFPQALENMRIMRISYLNRDYDNNVFLKWQAHRVTGEGIWDGMDGLTYMDRHMGYRFTIRNARLSHHFWRNTVRVRVELQNVGFAPAYHSMKAQLVLVDGQGREAGVLPLAGELRTLWGGRDRDKPLTLEGEIPAGELTPGDYAVCLRVWSEKYGRQIELANTQGQGEHGYLIGGIQAK